MKTVRDDFWLSVIILIGGGALLFLRPDYASQIFVLFGGIIGYWFGKRNGEREATASRKGRRKNNH